MELSEGTLQVLKNFASINSNIVIKQGNTLKTISEAKNVLASANILEDLPMDFGIYDLNQFLNVLSLVDVPRLNFTDNYVTIGDSTGRTQIKYFYSDIEMLTGPPSKDIQLSSEDVKFTLDNDTLNRIKRAASALEHTALAVSSSSGVVRLSVVDPENSTSNTFSIDVDGEFTEDNFNMIINISNLKMLPGNYDVSLSSDFISQFTNTENKIRYWIALEKSSTYGA